MKLIKTIVSCILIIGCISLTSFAALGYKQTYHIIPNVQFTQSWMNFIMPSTLLVDIVLPGSHDAGAYDMFEYAETQAATIGEQLAGGVRYFDLRLDGAGELVFYHGINSDNKFEDAAYEINLFVENNPTEFLVLNFQHFRNNGHHKALEVIDRVMNPSKYALSGDVDLSTLTYQDVLDKGARYMILFGTSKQEILSRSYIYNRSHFINSPYNSNNHNKGIDTLINSFAYYSNLRLDNKFFVLQAQSTAGLFLPTPSAFELTHSERLNQEITSFGDENSPVSLQNTNIIMRDYILRNRDNIPTILALNLKKGVVSNPSVFEIQINNLFNG